MGEGGGRDGSAVTWWAHGRCPEAEPRPPTVDGRETARSQSRGSATRGGEASDPSGHPRAAGRGARGGHASCGLGLSQTPSCSQRREISLYTDNKIPQRKHPQTCCNHLSAGLRLPAPPGSGPPALGPERPALLLSPHSDPASPLGIIAHLPSLVDPSFIPTCLVWIPLLPWLPVAAGSSSDP